MATPREDLAGTLGKLRLAFSSLQAVEEEVGARTAGLGALSLSQAASRVSQAASMAKAEAVKVVKAADAADAAAARAAEVVSVAQAARAAAAAKSAAAKAAVEAAEAALAAAAALEADIEPPAGMARMPSGSKSGSEAQGAMSCSGSQVEHCKFSVAIKAGESEMSEGKEEHSTSPTVEATAEAGNTHQQRRSEGTHGKDRGEEEEEEEEAPWRGKRKLGGTGKAARRQSVRAAGRPQPNYAEREPSKRQRKASKSGTGEDCGGGETVQQRRRQRDYSSDTKVRHNAGVARGTAAQHGHRTATKADFCSKRAKQGMVHVVSRRCGHPGCMKQSSYGTDGSKKAEFCSQHAKKGMVNVHRKRCVHSGCITCPSFGDAGSNKAKFCSRHAREGMVDVIHKSCRHPECMIQPSYGKRGSTKREFCSQHAKNGMVDLVHKRCGHLECMIQPSYGKRGSTKREFCSQHAREGMINVTKR